jgi:LPS sulfotransferase NodH
MEAAKAANDLSQIGAKNKAAAETSSQVHVLRRICRSCPYDSTAFGVMFMPNQRKVTRAARTLAACLGADGSDSQVHMAVTGNRESRETGKFVVC